VRTDSIVEYTQVWWSIRPHLDFGTVEVRICDAQTSAAESEALAALIVACVLQALRDLDERVPFADPPRRLVEENFWRAIRYGLDGTLIDLDRGEPFPAAAVVERLLQWTAPVRAEMGVEPTFPTLNGAQRQRRAIHAGSTMQEVYAAAVRETSQTYVEEAKTA
jgi:carboxylate-amine ligase